MSSKCGEDHSYVPSCNGILLSSKWYPIEMCLTFNRIPFERTPFALLDYIWARCIGASSMLFLSRSLGGLVRPRSPPLGSGKVGVRPNPGRCPGPWVVERPASGQTPDGTPVPGGWNGRRPAKPQTLPPFLGGGTAGVRPNPGQGGRTGAN